MATEGRIFDAEPHPDDRVEWLRAQVEEYLSYPHAPASRDELIAFVRWMEERFTPRGFLDR